MREQGLGREVGKREEVLVRVGFFLFDDALVLGGLKHRDELVFTYYSFKRFFYVST